MQLVLGQLPPQLRTRAFPRRSNPRLVSHVWLCHRPPVLYLRFQYRQPLARCHKQSCHPVYSRFSLELCPFDFHHHFHHHFYHYFHGPFDGHYFHDHFDHLFHHHHFPLYP